MTHHGYCYGVASRDLQGRQQGRLRQELGPARAVHYTRWDTELVCSLRPGWLAVVTLPRAILAWPGPQDEDS